MRLFEMLLMFLSIGALWKIIWFRNRPTNIVLWGIPSLFVIIGLCHLILEGWRWQMGLVYLSAIFVLFKYGWYVYHVPTKNVKGRLKPVLLSLFALPFSMVAVCLPLIFPVFTFESQTGPYKVGTITYTWTDSFQKSSDGKSRRINVQVWYPANPSVSSREGKYISNLSEFSKSIEKQYALPGRLLGYFDLVRTNTYQDAPFATDVKKAPLIFFSHGNMLGERFTNSFQTIELASQGYVVVALEHPGTALLSAYPDGTYISFEDKNPQLSMEYNLQNKASIPTIKQQTKDIEFVTEKIKQLSQEGAGSPFAGKVNLNRLGIIGHSLGGATAVNVLYKNQEFKAAINMDGYLYGEERQKALDQPLMIMNGGLEYEELDTPPEMKQIEEQRRSKVLGKGYILDIEQAGHLSFTDIPLYSPIMKVISPAVKRNHRIINEATLCFMDRHLKGEKNSSCELIPQHYSGTRIQTRGDAE